MQDGESLVGVEEVGNVVVDYGGGGCEDEGSGGTNAGGGGEEVSGSGDVHIEEVRVVMDHGVRAGGVEDGTWLGLFENGVDGWGGGDVAGVVSDIGMGEAVARRVDVEDVEVAAWFRGKDLLD